MLLEIAVIIGSLVQLAILYHCRHFKGQLPVMAESFQNMGNDLNENAVNAMSILEDLMEILEENGSPPNPLTKSNTQTGINPMELLMGNLISHVMSPNSHAPQEEIHTENENKTPTEVGN